MSRENNPLQKCRVELRIIDSCGSTFGSLVHQIIFFFLHLGGSVVSDRVGWTTKAHLLVAKQLVKETINFKFWIVREYCYKEKTLNDGVDFV